MKTYKPAVVLLSFFVLAGCGKDNADKVVLAQVGATKIVQSDIEKELKNAPESYRNYLGTIEGKKQFLDVLIKEKVLLNAAEKSDIAESETVKTRIKEFEERIEDQKKEFYKNLMLREYLQQLQTKDLNVTDKDIESYYNQKKADFDAPLSIAASHILVGSQQEAQEVSSRLKNGEDFAKLAKEKSNDPSASRGGAIGSFRRGDLSDLPEFEDALFSLQTGSTSGPVKTKLGYHIIRKDREDHLKAQSLEDASPYIRRLLEKKKFDDWISAQKQDQKVTIDEVALEKLDLSVKENLPTQGK